MLRTFVVVLAISMLSVTAIADEIILNDGSQIVGQIQTMAAGKVILKTDFVGDLVLKADQIRGMNTDQLMSVELQGGNRAVGHLVYTPENGQQVSAGALGEVEINMDQIATINMADGDSPEVAAIQAELEKSKNPWSSKLFFSIDGQTGNTERVAVGGRAEIHHVKDAQRLLIYAHGRTSRENGTDTVKEVIGGISLEVDIDEQWFGYGRTELEFDKFENLDLRLTVVGGVGHIVFSRPDEEFKVRVGIGFIHEDFDNGNTDDRMVAELGWDYRKEFTPHLLFTHSVTLLPSLEDIDDFRAVMDNAAEVPLSNNENWKLRVGIRNDYDSMPEAGVDRLDTYYYMNIVMESK